MGQINIDDIRPGMVLAASVTDPRGRVLLAPGCEITEKHLRILRMWGVTEADIEGVEKTDAVALALTEIDPDTLRRADAAARERLAMMDPAHPAVQELLRQCTLRLARHISRGETNAQ
jgi:hypothetical protein